MLYKKLMKLGLSEKEAKTYLAALELGASSVQKIAKKAGINRTTTYPIIEKLSQLGLMSFFQEGKKVYFYAEPPEKLNFVLIKKQKISLSEKIQQLQKMLPELKARAQKKNGNAFILFYKGSNGIRELTKQMFQAKDNIYKIIYNHDLIINNLSKQTLNKLTSERLHKNILAKVIRISTNKKISSKNAEMFNIDPKELEIFIDLSFFAKSMRIISLKKPISAIMINNEIITKTFSNIFDLLWNILQRKKQTNENIIYKKSE